MWLKLGKESLHCLKSVRIRRYSGTAYLSVSSPNAGKCGENADQNNSEYGHFLHSVTLDLFP